MKSLILHHALYGLVNQTLGIANVAHMRRVTGDDQPLVQSYAIHRAEMNV